MIGKKAPLFLAPAVVDGKRIVENFSLSQWLGKKYVVLFFYPKDFTFVCPTEIIAFQDLLPAFEERNTMVAGCSTDTENTHLAWLQTPRNKGGIQGVTYPLIADTAKTISLQYGTLGGNYFWNEEGLPEFKGVPLAYRGTFLIDQGRNYPACTDQ